MFVALLNNWVELSKLREFSGRVEKVGFFAADCGLFRYISGLADSDFGLSILLGEADLLSCRNTRSWEATSLIIVIAVFVPENTLKLQNTTIEMLKRTAVWGRNGDHISGMSDPRLVSPKLWASKYTYGPVDVFTDGGKLTGPLIDMYEKFHRP